MEKRYCKRCGALVKKSPVEGYPWYCPEHDEDLYDFETVTEADQDEDEDPEAYDYAEIMDEDY